MKRTLAKLFPAILLVVTTAACNRQYPGFDRDDTGVWYKIHAEHKDSAKVQTGDLITVDLTVRTKDSVLITSKEGMGMPYRFEVLPARFKGDIYDAFRLMANGDSTTFILKGDSLFIRDFEIPSLPPFISPTTMVYVDAKILDILPAAEFRKQKAMEEQMRQKQLMELRAQEPGLIQDYLSKNRITAQPTADGLYYIELRAGKGPRVEKGKTIVLNYMVRRITGEVFETSIKEIAVKNAIFDSAMVYEPFRFVMGDNSTIPGLEEGLALMKQGGKARMVIPSSLAYGDEGQPGFIDPCSPLVYEVEVLEVK